ncbi:MAG: hypothetical protein RL026_1618 [Pseudomonadota bacterium]|jgi:prolyl 4-hydroxylase
MAGMNTPEVPADLRHWIDQQARAGVAVESMLASMHRSGWSEAQATACLETVLRDFLAVHAPAYLPAPDTVAAPGPKVWPGLDAAAERLIDGHAVQVLARLRHPRAVVLGNLLTAQECTQLIELARPRVQRSRVVDPLSGGEQEHAARTSEGMCFQRGENALCERIEQRLALLLEYPVERGEGLQVLRYAPGAEYQPHFDYFDPAQPGMSGVLARGGQRVATVVMYLNTPVSGGATVFPDSGFEVAAQRGNAVFFSYDAPDPATGSLHGGAPVIDGEKWIATKWLREARHD